MQLSRGDYERFFKALKYAENGEHEVRVGAVGVVGGNIISVGWNTSRNHPSICDFGEATYHAEMNVLRRIPFTKISRTTLYIARLSKRDHIMPSRPCNRCLGEIKAAGIKSMVFLDNHNQLVKTRLGR